MVFFDSILNYVLVRVHVFKHYSQDMLFVNSPLLMLTVSNQANDFPIEKYPVELHLNPISVNGTVCKFREKIPLFILSCSKEVLMNHSCMFWDFNIRYVQVCLMYHG